MFDDFLDEFYPDNHSPTINNAAAQRIKKETKALNDEIIVCRAISKGNWPFQPTLAPITGWDRNRLSLLIVELGLKITLPLLLASYHLGERKFSEVVQLIEKFLFRYKVVCNEHIEAAATIFHRHSVQIRGNVASYDINTLKIDLSALITSRANDTHFKNNIEKLSYKLGGGNKPVKYFLMTLEHYKRWYDSGASGVPKCIDKTRIYDFSSTTIEHIYPRNASGANVILSIEARKNEIENLTFMGPTDNVAGSNDNFATKKPIFIGSSVGINQGIGNLGQWMETELEAQKTKYKNMACKVFSL